MNFKTMNNFFKHLTDEIGVPSVDCLIHKDGEEIYRYKGGEAFDATKKLYYLYSVTKPMTCTAALQLFEKGKFLLNDPVSNYLPEFKEMHVKKKYIISDEGIKTSEGKSSSKSEEKLEIVKAKNPILIKHLFTMSAGFNYNRQTDDITKLKKETDGRFPTGTIAKAVAKQPLSFEPGEHWQYSLCHDVLGALIEVVAQMKFSDYMRKYIWDPLEMADTTMKVTDDVLENMLPQFRYDSEKCKAFEIAKDNDHILGSEYESGGAGIISSVDDYIKFADALALNGTAKNGYRLLNENTIELMTTNHLNETQLTDLNWSQLKGYGYGLGIRTMMNKTEGGALSPVGEFGWGGAAGAYLMIDRKNKIGLFYGQHMLNNLEPYIHPRIRNIVYSCLT